MSACIEWTAGRSSTGYGAARSPTTNRKTTAHRAAWELEHGPIPNGLWVLHHCDNPPCVNLEHLFLGTQKDNMADMIGKGRDNLSHGFHGENHPRARLNWRQVCDIRSRPEERARALAIEYGVSRHTIAAIRCGRNWKRPR